MNPTEESILLGVFWDLASISPVRLSVERDACQLQWDPAGEGTLEISVPFRLWSEYVELNHQWNHDTQSDLDSQNENVRSLAHIHIMENLNSLDVNPDRHRQPDIIRLNTDSKTGKPVWERVYR